MSEDTTTTEETTTEQITVDAVDMADIAALAMAIAIWLGNQNPDALEEIGNMADALKEKFIAGE